MTAKSFWGALPFSSGSCLALVGGVDINCRIVALGLILFPVHQEIFYQDLFLHLIQSTLYSVHQSHQLHHTFYIYTTCIRSTTVYSSNIMNPLTTMASIRVASLPKPYLCLAVRGYTSAAATTGLRYGTLMASKKHHQITSKRYVASTPTGRNKEYFPPPKADQIQEVVSSWSHPV